MESFASHRGNPDPVNVGDGRVIEQMRDQAMFLIDRRGRTASWNEGVREILGWDESEWIGQPLTVGSTPQDLQAGSPAKELVEAAETGSAFADRWMVRKNGEPFYALATVTRVLDETGAFVGFLKVLRDFTGPKRAEQEQQRLLASEHRARADAERQAAALTAAIEAIPDGFYMGGADGISRCNAPALDMLGASSLADLDLPADEWGRKFCMRYEREGPLVEPGQLPFARALKGETAVLEAWATKASTGEDVFIRGTAAPILVEGRIVGAVAINSDQTERLKLQRERYELSQVETVLHERDEQLRALVDGVRDYAIFTVDVEGTIASWHEGASRMKGYTVAEAVGMPFANLFTPEDRLAGLPQQEMEIASRTGEYKGEGRRLRKDGSTFEAAVVLTALRGPDGTVLGYLKLTQDISERKRQEVERAELLRYAQAARSDAERSSHSKDEFLAMISHELRTPLGAIVGWAHVLERGMPDTESMKKGLAAITRNARVQVQLIEDLLDMNRIESGQLRLELQPVDMAGVIAAAVDIVLPAASAKGIVLRTLLDPAAGVVMGDTARLQQIVWNLLNNAVKFTPAAGKVTLSLEGIDDGVRISVADTGQGIGQEFLARVFERFQQEDATTTRRYGGLGIGLAIVRELVQLHGGTVSASSAGPGLGSAFAVTLPRLAESAPKAKLAAAVAPAGSTQHAESKTPRLDGITVLLVDDEADGRAVAEHVLQAAGARVLSASSAQEGFDLFRVHRPQVILSDIGMPGQDGYDLLRWIRSLDEEQGGRTPAAALTAYARAEDRQRVLAVGYQEHLVKPAAPADLVRAVGALAQAPRSRE